ncbi:MAG TPA: NUDIX domain-containing protein [Candidatus Limnocylindrales bacterium]|nr:NUDIX domain-containing protein [Candidatus Limnocylindrales bacterium]
MKKRSSAGCLLFRRTNTSLEVLLAHMGGPYWARKDDGSWSIPKGEYDDDSEDPFEVALREFEEELGSPVPAEHYLELGSARQPSGKIVTIWAAEGDFDPATAVSNTFTMEWPKGSGNERTFPEIDRVAWFDVAAARTKLLRGQVVFLDRLVEKLESSPECSPAAV